MLENKTETQGALERPEAGARLQVHHVPYTLGLIDAFVLGI